MAHDTDPLLKAVQPNSNNSPTTSSSSPSLFQRARSSLASLGKKDGPVELGTLSVNGNRSDYIELPEDEKPVEPDNRFFDAVALALFDMVEEHRIPRPADLSKPTQDEITAEENAIKNEHRKAELRAKLSQLFHPIDFNNPEFKATKLLGETRNDADIAKHAANARSEAVKQLSQKLRQKSKEYVDALDQEIHDALPIAFREGTLKDIFKKHQLEALEKPENSTVSFGQSSEDGELLFFKEGALTNAEKDKVAEHFLKLPPKDAARAALAKIIYNTFWGYVLEAPIGFRRISDKLNKPDLDDAARGNIHAELLEYCHSDAAIKSYLFDDVNHKAAIYYSRAFNHYFKDHTLPQKFTRADLVQFLMERNDDMRGLRAELGKEIRELFTRHPELQTPRFKNFIFDRPVRNADEEAELERNITAYCESEEAISWYAFNTSFQKSLHQFYAAKILFSSKDAFFGHLIFDEVVHAYEKVSKGEQYSAENAFVKKLYDAEDLREALYVHIAKALENCKEVDPYFKRPESYETLLKQYDEPLITSDEQEAIGEKIKHYAQTKEAYLWYLNTYLAHPNTGLPEELYKLFQLLSPIPYTINIWEKSADNAKKLTLKATHAPRDPNGSQSSIDLFVIPGVNPERYAVLHRLNFTPHGDYETFCYNYGKRATDTVNWVKKTIEQQSPVKKSEPSDETIFSTKEFRHYKDTMGTTRAGCPEIEGVIVCEMLAKESIPLTMAVTEYDKKQRPKSHSFVSQDGCIPNPSSLETLTDASTITLVRSPNKKIPGDDFSAVLLPKENGELEALFDGDWSVNFEVHPSIRNQLPLVVAETVETKDKAGKTGKKQVQPHTLVNAQVQQEVTIDGVKQARTVDGARKMDNENIPEIIVGDTAYKQKPVRSKTEKEIEDEKDENALASRGIKKDSIRLAEVLRQDGDPRYRALENIDEEAVDYPNVEVGVLEEEAVVRPAAPSFTPTEPYKPVLLEKTVKPGFIHKPLAEKKPETVFAPVDVEKIAALTEVLPSWVALGNASIEDSFFDTIAQQLNQLENTDTHDAASLRLLTKCQEKEFNWAVLAVDICQRLNVSLHVAQLHDNHITHLLVTDKPNEIREAEIDWKNPRTLHVAAHANSNPTRFVPLSKKPVKENHFFKAMADGLNNVVFGNKKVSKEEFYTEQYLRDACDDRLTTLPERNWVKAQLNSDPAYVDYFQVDGINAAPTEEKPDDKGKDDVPLVSDKETPKNPAGAKKRKVITPYDIYRKEVRFTEANKKDKTLPINVDLEARLMCESLSATGKDIQIQLFEVQEEDVPNEKGVFSRKKVIKKHYLYNKNGREEITDPKKVNWGSSEVVTLIYDQDNDHVESCGSHLPRTTAFKVTNAFIHVFYGASLSYAMGMQALAAGVPAIVRGYSAAEVIMIMLGSGLGKFLLLYFYAFYNFGGWPSTLDQYAFDISNLDEHMAAMFEAFHTGNWSWGEDVLPKMGNITLALFPAFFFGSLNNPILKGPDAFPTTVLNNQQMFQGWASHMIDLAHFINNNVDAAYRLAFFSSFTGNLISARPIVEQIKRVIDKCIRDAKNVKDKGVYENARFWLGIIAGTGISVFVTMGFINFWQLSTGVLYKDMIGADIPGAMLGYTLSAGIMAFITGLGFCAAMPLGRKFMEYLFDICAGDLQFEDGDFRQNNPEYQGFRAWWSEQTAVHKGLFIAAYAIAGGIVFAGAFPNVFQADLANDTKFFAGCAFLASMITELEGTETVSEKILHKIKEFFEWIGLKIVDLVAWLRDKAHDFPFAIEFKIRLVNSLEKHFPDVCKPGISNALCAQRYGLFNQPVVLVAAADPVSLLEPVAGSAPVAMAVK